MPGLGFVRSACLLIAKPNPPGKRSLERSHSSTVAYLDTPLALQLHKPDQMWPPGRVMGASPAPHRYLAVAPLIGDKRCYGEVTVRFPGEPGAGIAPSGVRGWAVRSAKLGSDGSPQRGKRAKSPRRGTSSPDGRFRYGLLPGRFHARTASVNTQLRLDIATSSRVRQHSCLPSTFPEAMCRAGLTAVSS
jgi:hypothetical protein